MVSDISVFTTTLTFVSNLLASRKMTGSKSEDLSVLGHLILAADLVCGDEALDLPAGGGVPHADCLVVAAAHQLLVVGGVHHLLDAARATLELDDRLRSTRLLQVKYPDNQS